MNINLKIAKETEKLTLEGLTYNAAFRKAKEMYKEKAPYPTDQSKDEEHAKTINNIIPPGTNIDNGELDDDKTGQAIRDLRGI